MFAAMFYRSSHASLTSRRRRSRRWGQRTTYNTRQKGAIKRSEFSDISLLFAYIILV